MLQVSVRRNFKCGDRGWEEYISSAGLPKLECIRTIDTSLNEYVHDRGDYTCQPDEIANVLALLPAPTPGSEYLLFAVNLDRSVGLSSSTHAVAHFEHNQDYTLLGHDLTDETQTSSLLNCGRWLGALRVLALRLNEHGLLSLEDAREAQRLLPQEWGEDEPHAHVDVWALYTVAEGS